ncbi:TfoX/Sxy family protein [Thalassococcus sp. S3]|uniref:TfoX/Sxy family protein n=1 Tax=Thalassococcus sp. S3 TaxID=2017482 RepID=UPI0013EE6ADE|nr:TfoX/Sxy family protein [Thalassococcus sp. S3]
MAYDEDEVARVRATLEHRSDVKTMKMMGGLIFMVAGHMCCGVRDGYLMVRLGADAAGKALKKPFVVPMQFKSGRQPKGFIRVAPEGYESDADLAAWVAQAEAFVATLPARSQDQ